jgi:two-component system nitrogen regulation response regulator GlnG/two-component system response regulator HydG
VTESKTVSIDEDSGAGRARPAPRVPALLIAWSAAEPRRIGEVALFDEKGERVLGRGGTREETDRVTFVRQRPDANEPAPPLGGLALSRRQLLIRATPGGLEIERVGRCETRVGGAACDRATLTPGSTLLLKGQLLLFCTTRPLTLPPLRHFPARALGPFGEADETGILGESEPLWTLRERIGFISQASAHALLLGASGTGKELAAHAIHALSARKDRSFLARNAATIPATLIDAELFGNAKNYPNPGMPDRPGLVGQANGGTLFLDEIAELGHDLQAHLLRVLDAHGEYQRLGEATMRQSDFRLIGATNRDESAMKHDVLARLTLRAHLPPLERRREDVPLLVQHLLLRAAKKSPALAERFLGDHDGQTFARVDPALVEHLLQRPFPANLRDLDGLLWRAMAGSEGNVVALTEEILAEAPPPPVSARSSGELTAAEVRAVVEREKGNIERAAKQLGLKNRFALYRLMKKLAIETTGDEEDEPE